MPSALGLLLSFFTFSCRETYQLRSRMFFFIYLERIGMLDNEVQPSFRNILNSNCAWIIPSTFPTFIDNKSSRTFSSGSSRHGNAQRAPVDWNWVNLMMKKRRKTRKQNNFKELPQIDLSNDCCDWKLSNRLRMLQTLLQTLPFYKWC